MRQKVSHNRRSRFRAMLVFLACTATLALIVSAALLFHLFFADALRGNKLLTVPDLTGAILTGGLPQSADGFQIVRIEEHSDTPQGTVLGQSPAAGSRRKCVPGKRYVTLTLYVSKGPETETVPFTVGSSVDDAVYELLSRGFLYNRIECYDDAPTGEVIAQSHAAGTELPKGETVTLTVSKGEKKRRVQIPVLSGLSLVEAKSLAEALGLRIGTVSYSVTTSDGEQVLTQFPPPGARAPIGTEIALTLSKKAPDETEASPPEGAEDTLTESSGPSEESPQEPPAENRERPMKDKKREPHEDPFGIGDTELDRILDRLFEQKLPFSPH